VQDKADVTPERPDISLAEFATWYADHPNATLVAGATDVGLWVTKQLRDLDEVGFLGRCPELKTITRTENTTHFGAGVTMTDVLDAIRKDYPSYAEMIRRYGSTQVRNAATIGGNIANGSPIGDNPPALIALGATLHLQLRDTTRDMPIEDFFVAYGKQDRQPGELVTGITLPLGQDAMRVYKLSKRFDQDISAVCGAFNIVVENGIVTSARIAFGGMAATPHRATVVEAALVGQVWSAETIEKAVSMFGKDYTPMSDMRATANYRMTAAGNMLRRYFAETSGSSVSVLEVQA
jgi:xanthine dehydrogenase small subunit